MNEKQYKTVGSTAISSLVIGIVITFVGIAAGVLTIVNAARLLKLKEDVLI